MQDHPSSSMSPSNTHNSETWKAYWKEQGQPWRTEPAIDEERQQRLLSYYQGVADIERGMYPFKGSPYYPGKTYAKEATRGNWGEKWLRNAHFRLLFQQMMQKRVFCRHICMIDISEL